MDTDGPIFSSASASPPPISSAVLRCPLGTDRVVNKIPMQKPSCWMRFNGGLDADRAADPLDDAFRSFRLFPEHPRGRGRRRRRRGGRGEDGRRPRLTVLPLVPPVPLGQHAGQRRSKPVREGGGGDEQHGRAATARARLAHCRQSCLHCARDSLPHNHHHQREGGRERNCGSGLCCCCMGLIEVLGMVCTAVGPAAGILTAIMPGRPELMVIFVLRFVCIPGLRRARAR